LSNFNDSSLISLQDCVISQNSPEEMKPVSGRFISQVSRRNFLATLGIATGSAGVLTLGGCSGSSAAPNPPTPPIPPAPPVPPIPPPALSMVDLLNFALNFEYLGASFYLYVTTGNGLSSTDLGAGAGAITGIPKVNFTNQKVAVIAQAIAADEVKHVQFLRSTISSLGGTPVSAPAINLAAMGAVTSDATFLALGRQLATVGYSAYASLFLALTDQEATVGSNTAALTYAAQILDTESQHEGNLRQLCINLGVTSNAVDGYDRPPSSTAIFNTLSFTGTILIRSTSSVLQIVYAASAIGVTSGGFFPSGLNGNIKTI
jgi:hypothetical protein